MTARRAAVLAMSVGMLLIAAGLSFRASRRPRADLLALFPQAEARAETASVTFGDPQARDHFLAGFSSAEGAPPHGFRWGTGPHSEMEIVVVEPRPLRLELRGSPFTFPDAPEQAVTVGLNGRSVVRFPLARGSHSYRVPLAAEALVAGANRLTFDYAVTRKPSEVRQGSDDRSLSVAWEELRLFGVPPAAAPHASATTLVLPARTQVDYALEVAGPAVLHVDRVSAADAAGGGRLEVVWATFDAPPRTWQWPARGRSLRVSLPAAPGPARLILRALSEPGRAVAGGGLELRQPVVLGANAPVPYPPLSLPPSAPAPAAGARPNIIIYLVDALRADHLGCYGYDRPTSPELDAFAKSAALFTHFFAQASYTKPAVASIFTGLHAPVHRVTTTEATLPAGATTLAERLRAQGYATAAVVTNDNVAPAFGYARGFDTYDYLPTEHTEEMYPRSDRLNERAFAWLAQRPAARPFFLYVHTADPHAPYTPPAEWRRRFAPAVDPEVGTLASVHAFEHGTRPVGPTTRDDLMRLYDAEIAFNDQSFGVFLRELERLGLLKTSVVIFTADHGEEFYERGGWEHATSVYTEQIHVPLVVRLPDGRGAGTRIGTLAQQIDLLPTLVAMAGGPRPSGLRGEDLGPALDGSDRRGSRRVFSHLAALRVAPGEFGDDAESVVTDGWQLVWKRSADVAPRRELFDLEHDPRDARDLRDLQPVWAFQLDALREAGNALLVPLEPQRPPSSVDPELIERIHGLGYVQ